jgi:uncharacterized SAM-binding protein YcdF (DUF218 family)
MKITEIKKEVLMALPYKEKYEFVCGDIRDDGMSAPVALLLGGNPNNARNRALAAAELYLAGRVPYIVPSGGVKWDIDGEGISESHYMKRILMEKGVPEEAIILENQATTTKENMIFGTLQINRKLKFEKVDHVIIVTSEAHMKRSIALANAFLPRKVTVSAYPAFHNTFTDEWFADEKNRKALDTEVRLLKDMADSGLIEDMDL